jgi:hypothetical protein
MPTRSSSVKVVAEDITSGQIVKLLRGDAVSKEVFHPFHQSWKKIWSSVQSSCILQEFTDKLLTDNVYWEAGVVTAGILLVIWLLILYTPKRYLALRTTETAVLRTYPLILSLKVRDGM